MTQIDKLKKNYRGLRNCAVIAPNLHRRYSGITSVVITIVPELTKHIAIASVGPHLPARVPRIKWWQLFSQGWSKPSIAFSLSAPEGLEGSVGLAQAKGPHPNPPPAEEGKTRRFPMPHILKNARDLRKNSTTAENLLWYALRQKQMGVKFRRQHPVGTYIADFASLHPKLVIELDGGQHNEEKAIQYDEKRTRFLEAQGYKVLRFWNNDVLANLENVLETIYHELLPFLPPQGGGQEGGVDIAQAEGPHPSPPPAGRGIKQKRIWHARRNDEMIVGIFLRDVLRQPWLLTFTSTAQRHHTAFTRWLMRRMDGLIAGSALAARYLKIPATVIDNSIETARFTPAPDRDAAWAQTGLPGKYGIGVFGRVRHQKGTDVFVEAMCRLLPTYPDFTAIIVGLAAPEQEEFTEGLRVRIRQAGLEDRILFLGEVPQGDVPKWFARLTVYAAPMRREGFGLTPIEAMASGVAVVATRAGAHEQIVVEGETGHLVPPSDLETLVAAIQPLMQNPQRAIELGRKGRIKALEQHDVALEAAKTLKTYELLWAGQPLPDERPSTAQQLSPAE